MKRTKKMLATVVALAMMLSVGNVKTVSAEAATCPPHGSYVDRHVASSYPQSATHELYKYNADTNRYDYIGDCSYSYQYHTIAIVCTECNKEVSRYNYRSEIHITPGCEEYLKY